LYHISRPPTSEDTYGSQLWSRILRDQLHVIATEFWACVQNGTVPSRGVAAGPVDSIPADVLAILRNRGVPEQEALNLGREKALALMYELLSKPKP
jgi:hypothetical protein